MTSHPPHHPAPPDSAQAPVLLRSRLLERVGVPHAFTTRLGGLSAPPFDSLNLGNPSELPPERRDPRERILANWALITRALGCSARELVEVHQVHGSTVHVVRPGRPAHLGQPPGMSTKADAIATDDPSRLIAVRVADCAPVLLCSADGHAVAAVHAGWRGVVDGVATAAVHALRTLTAQPLLAAIGPCIGPAAFEVGPEVDARFREAFGRDAEPWIHRPSKQARESSAGKSRVDLRAALRHQLRAVGVEQIDDVPGCTAAEPHRFFSHRRDKGLTGRMAGLIGPISPGPGG